MKFLLTTKLHRFLIYVIDFVLISIIADYIALGVETLFGFDRSLMNTYGQSMVTEFYAVMQGKSNSLDVLYTYMSKYIQCFFIDFGFKIIFDLVLVIIFLVIIPHYWGGKTLGRRAANSKLVDKDGNDATLKHFILREIVGTYLFYCVLGAFFGLVGIITFILVIATSRSIPDRVSGTYMVYDTPMKEQPSAYVYVKEEKENEVAPDYKEVNNNYNNDNNYDDQASNEDDSQDKYNVDDDDYKIVWGNLWIIS